MSDKESRFEGWTIEEISDLLRDYYRCKTNIKQIREEMIKLAVEELGMDQKEAINCDIAMFLNGYLVGCGMQQSWRNIK